MRITITDTNPDVALALLSVFGIHRAPAQRLYDDPPVARIGDHSVEILCGSIFDVEAKAIVSPANSFGFMDGGIDALYSRRWPGIQEYVQRRIWGEPDCELLVGRALAVCLETAPYDTMIVAPTMRTPRRIPPVNVFLATRAAVKLASQFDIESVVMPGMGTGAGRVPPLLAAKAMAAGVNAAFNPHEDIGMPFKSWRDAEAFELSFTE